MMSNTHIEQEIALLEKRLAQAKAARPAHDTTGAYQAKLLEIEDQLAEKRQALAALGVTDGAESTQPAESSVKGGNVSDKAPRMPEGCSIVACGTLRREMRRLAETGFLDGDRLFFTAPGLHEWPEMLEQQLTQQLEKARGTAGRVVVAYGEKCYLDTETGLDTDGLLGRFGTSVGRVRAKNCVDMLAGADERSEIAEGAKVYWLTPGWVQHWDFIFKDWDAAKANETFPANDKAIILDALGYFDEASHEDPEKILRICDWMKLPLEASTASLERLKDLLRQCAQGPAISGARSSTPWPAEA